VKPFRFIFLNLSPVTNPHNMWHHWRTGDCKMDLLNGSTESNVLKRIQDLSVVSSRRGSRAPTEG
jgi:hypothetical protein